MSGKGNNPGSLVFDPADPSGLPYGCKLCGTRFVDRMKGVGHFAQKHTEPKLPVPCQICGKLFQPGVGITSHLRAHLKKLEEKAKTVSQVYEVIDHHYTFDELSDIAGRDRNEFYAVARKFGVHSGKGMNTRNMIKGILRVQDGEQVKLPPVTNGKKPHKLEAEADDSVDSVVNRIAHKLLIDRLRDLERQIDAGMV